MLFYNPKKVFSTQNTCKKIYTRTKKKSTVFFGSPCIIKAQVSVAMYVCMYVTPISKLAQGFFWDGDPRGFSGARNRFRILAELGKFIFGVNRRGGEVKKIFLAEKNFLFIFS